MADDAGGAGDAGDAGEPSEPNPTASRPPVLLDVMLGTLTRYLRMCGYDAAYALDREIEADERILSLAAAEGRAVVTRDRELAARATRREAVPDGTLLSERDVLDQLRELDAAGFRIELAAEPARCGSCNGPVERVGGAGVDERVTDADRPDYVPDDVGADRPGWRCRECGQWFWKGSHWADVASRLDGLCGVE